MRLRGTQLPDHDGESNTSRRVSDATHQLGAADPVELTPENAPAYLRTLGFATDRAEVEPLGWGISNVVLRVRTGDECFVIKQSLPRLRVETVWEFDRRRIYVERDCMDYLGSILPPGSVPAVRFSDPDNFVFAMSCAPPGGVLWKEALLRGDVDEGAAERAGALLAELQRCAAADPACRQRFDDRRVLIQGRLDPYHRTAAAANPDVRDLVEEEIERMLATRCTLVLGDYAPKNAFIYPHGFLILDFEVAHWGDPAFDPAFCLNHLLLKAIRWPERSDQYLAAARTFWRTYRQGISGDYAAGVEWATARELACLLLARIDGKSRAEYIEEEPQRAFARRLAKDALVDQLAHPEEILSEGERRLASAEAVRRSQ